MMKATLMTRSLLLAGLISSLPTAQAAGTWFEARNDAMGGTGVASSKYGAAPLLNPALLPARVRCLGTTGDHQQRLH